MLCPDPVGKSVDIGFFDQEHSDLSICVKHPDGTWETLPTPAGAKCEVRIERRSPRGMGRFYLNPRGREEDDRDFRWMVLIGRLHPAGVNEIQNAAKHLFSAVVGIKDADFFTKQRSQNEATIIDEQGYKLDELDYLGRLLGACLTCDPNDPADDGFSIYIREVGHSNWTEHPFDGKAKPYTVILETLPEDEENHMSMLYNLFDVADTRDDSRYSIVYKKESKLELCGATGPFIGDSSTGIFYLPDDDKVILISPPNRVELSSKLQAFLEGYRSWRTTDQYACQTFPDGDGPFDYP